MDILEVDDERRSTDPLDIAVQLNVRVPYHYREQLIAEAKRQRLSLNRLIVNAIVRSIPPERT